MENIVDKYIAELLAALLVAVLGAVLVVVRSATGAIKAELASRKGKAEYELARELAGTAVRYTEALGIKLGLNGPEKLDVAIGTLDTLLLRYGIDIDDEAVKQIIIEDKVFEELNSFTQEIDVDLANLRDNVTSTATSTGGDNVGHTGTVAE